MSTSRALSPLIYRYGLKVRYSSTASSIWDIQHRTADAGSRHWLSSNTTVRTTMACRNMSERPKTCQTLSIDDMNPNIKVMEYAVRGPLVIRAAQLEKELAKGNENQLLKTTKSDGAKRPFKEIIRANIGDCHAMGQKPITFIRQVLALVTYPEFLEDKRFPDDVKERARTILAGCKGGSVGSYTDSPGIEIIRRHVKEYIEQRDGIPSDWENIIVTAGASDAIKGILKLLICDVGGKKPGVMIPIPQYPLYTASLAEFDMVPIGYYLDEDKGWSLELNELERAFTEAKINCFPRALVLINPGNPTGQVLTKENIQGVIRFAHKNKLFLLADEVYQDNVYDPNSQFHSFKKVMMEMGDPYCKMELASFMSVSKGYMGECGLRGGYTEVINMDPAVKVMYLKALSAMLCPTVLGQTVVDAVVNPPKKGEPSYDLWVKEKTAVLDSLKLRAKMVADTFNSLKGFKCNPVQGAMYCFPQFTLPPKVIEEAERKNMEPDVFYAFELLESTGICIVPGSGFGQRKGTYHFRTTILPQPELLKRMLQKFDKFHHDFIKKYE